METYRTCMQAFGPPTGSSSEKLNSVNNNNYYCLMCLSVVITPEEVYIKFVMKSS